MAALAAKKNRSCQHDVSTTRVALRNLLSTPPVDPVRKKTAAAKNSKVKAGNKPALEICPICDSNVEETHQAIFCDGACKQWFHRCCASVPLSRYKVLASASSSSNPDDQDSDPFYCPSCNFAQQKGELESLRAELVALKAKVEVLEVSIYAKLQSGNNAPLQKPNYARVARGKPKTNANRGGWHKVKDLTQQTTKTASEGHSNRPSRRNYLPSRPWENVSGVRKI